jgi:hypothetical protein
MDATIVPTPPKEAIELSFEPIHEPWNIYKTKSGVLIKARLIVLKFFLAGIGKDGTAQLGTHMHIFFVVTAPQELKGKPDEQARTHEEEIAATVEPYVPFDKVKEDWNEYDVEGIKVGVKLVVSVIARTSLYDLEGQPIYHYSFQKILRPITKAEDKETFQKIWAERGSGKH